MTCQPHSRRMVAPHWGAWIEITRPGWLRPMGYVAPHWGVWIEIRTTRLAMHGSTSHPTGVRGLKLQRHPRVARVVLSHPTGVRGLKSDPRTRRNAGQQSHPTGVRGLK